MESRLREVLLSEPRFPEGPSGFQAPVQGSMAAHRKESAILEPQGKCDWSVSEPPVLILTLTFPGCWALGYLRKRSESQLPVKRV